MPSRAARSGRSKDERAGFFRDLRALRARRGLSLADIAGRTRFPADTLAAVESGPGLPPLPALEAYLRGCGEPLAAWEDRWRQLDQLDRAAAAAAAAAIADGGDLPVREAGTSPLAAAGAALAGAPASPGQAPYTIKRLGAGSARNRRPAAGSAPKRRPGAGRRRIPALRFAAAAGAAALAATGGVALLAWGHTDGGLADGGHAARGHPAGGHRGVASAAPRVPGGKQPTAMPPRSAPPGGPPGGAPRSRPVAAVLEVAGIGCPQDSVTVANAPAGPGWTASDGGWTRDGCDGSTVWTMDPTGTQPAPSALTWKFGLAAGVSHCTLAVFVPTRNALGVGEYAVFNGDATTAADIASVAVSQATADGQWVTLGSYPVRGTTLEIQVAPSAGTAGVPGPGAGAGPGAHGRQPAAAQGPGHNSAIAASAAMAACG